jgi:hypothetical protein
MQVISVAFKLTIYEFWVMEIELLGMPRREVWWNFSKRYYETYGFFASFICSVKLRSWGFLGGSIDTIGCLCIFHLKFELFPTRQQFWNDI